METTLKITTLAQLLALAEAGAQYQIGQTIHPQAAYRYGLAGAILAAAGLPVPAVLSGYRSLAQQKALHDQGLKAARNSWHTLGLAFDLDTASPTFPLFAALWKALGGRDGRDFSDPDPGHVDFPLQGITPQAAF